MNKSNFYLKKSIYSLALLFLFSCSTDNVNEDTALEASNTSNLSSKSVKLSISDTSASTEQSSNPASNATDGNSDSTRWSGQGASVNLDLDLGAVKPVDYIRIAYYKGDTRLNYFSYWVSDNGDSWTYVQKKTSSGTTDGFETFDLTNNSTRYVRIECQGTSTGIWNSLFEIEVYGTDSESESETETIEPTSTTTTSDGTFQLSDFDIETSWNNSGTSTDSESATSVDNEEWYDKVGSTYVLKCSEEDGNRTEWKEKSGNESSLSANKIMEYTTKITDIPENGVTIAQIHNRGGVKRPLLRVYIEDNEVKIKVTTSDPSNSSASYNTYDDNELRYTEGSDISVKIETSSNGAKITITTTSGSYSETIVPSSNWDDFSNDYYLKAGVYTEGDDTEPTSTFSEFLFTRD